MTQLGLNPRKTDILVVKIGYLVPELYNIRADWIMALTPGGVDKNLERLDYKRIKRPMYPKDIDMETTDLSARFVPLSDSDDEKYYDLYYVFCLRMDWCKTFYKSRFFS